MEKDGRTEFKRQFTKESMKSVVAFSNTEGGALCTSASKMTVPL